jgi:hypothetical protein
MPQRYTIPMLLMQMGTPRDQEAREALAALLPDADVGEPDEIGAFDIALDADDEEAALTRIWDAIAESGSDDHILFLEHPELPEHWRHRSAKPAG